MNIPTIRCRCEAGHEWEIVLPKYYFSVPECHCPECEKPVMSMVMSMKAGEPFKGFPDTSPGNDK